MTRRKTEPFVMLTAALIGSPAWRTMGINVKRLIDFLIEEHLSHGGRENGGLLAPWNQLETRGIGRRFIAQTVEEAVRRGLLDVRKGVGRTPSRYTLTFLPTFIGQVEQPPSDRWREYRDPADAVAVHQGEPERCTKVHHKSRSGSPSCTTNPVVVHLGEVHEGEHLSRDRSYQDGSEYSVSERRKGPICAA
jgi:hypothetical protein